jgi:hypothetical protein
MEVHMGVPIIYGQGNLLFDMPSAYSTWHEGCLVRLTIERKDRCEIQLVPYKQSAETQGARLMSENDEVVWREAFDERSRHLFEPEVLEERWRAFCDERKCFYLHLLHGKPSLLRRILGKLDLLHYLDGADKQRDRLSIIRCESHYDALKTILELEATRQRGKASH